MNRTTLAIPAAFAAGAILFSLGASVAGQTNVVDTTKIRACVNSAGSPRFLAAGVTTCRSSERLVEWNAQGPAGASGPVGPSGPAGLKGAKGDKGDKGEPGLDAQRGFFDVFPEFSDIGRITLDPPPAGTTTDATTDSVAILETVIGRKVYGLTTGQGLSDADADNDGMTDRVAAGDINADGFGPVSVDIAVDGQQPSLAEASARKRAFHEVTIFVEADMDGDGLIHADEAGNADEGLVLRLEEARIIRHGYSAGTDFLGGQRHDAAMSSIGNIRARTISGDRPTLRTPMILEHIEFDYERVEWISSNGGIKTSLGRWDLREGRSD